MKKEPSPHFSGREPVEETNRGRRFLETVLLVFSALLLPAWVFFPTMGNAGKWALAATSALDTIFLVLLYRARRRKYRAWIDKLRVEYTGSPHKIKMPGVFGGAPTEDIASRVRPDTVEHLFSEGNKKK